MDLDGFSQLQSLFSSSMMYGSNHNPTPVKAVTTMLRLARLGRQDVLYDLGCGDGRIVVAAALMGAKRACGIDHNPASIHAARKIATDLDLTDRVIFSIGDMFAADISLATVVVLYHAPSVNLRLMPILLANLKPGARVIAFSFAIGDWMPDEIERACGRSVFLWTVSDQIPKKVDMRKILQRRLTLAYKGLGDLGLFIAPSTSRGHGGFVRPHSQWAAGYQAAGRRTYIPILINCSNRKVKTASAEWRFVASGGSSASAITHKFELTTCPILARTEHLLFAPEVEMFCLSRISDRNWISGSVRLVEVEFSDGEKVKASNS